MLITKGEWQDWQENPVTKAFFEAARFRVEDTKEILAVSAGLDPIEDRFFVGFIQAYQEMSEFKIEDLDES